MGSLITRDKTICGSILSMHLTTPRSHGGIVHDHIFLYVDGSFFYSRGHFISPWHYVIWTYTASRPPLFTY